jgi:hypothetical protein
LLRQASNIVPNIKVIAVSDRILDYVHGSSPVCENHASYRLIKGVTRVLRVPRNPIRDLQFGYRDRFDTWWEEKKASLPIATVPFSVIVQLRPQALKSGELLPGMRVVVRLDHPAVEEAAFTVNLREGRIVTSAEESKFRREGAPTLRLCDPNDLDEVATQLIPALRPVFESLNQDEPPFEVSSLLYKLEDAAPAVTFAEGSTVFDSTSDVMREIVAEGDELFANLNGDVS